MRSPGKCGTSSAERRAAPAIRRLLLATPALALVAAGAAQAAEVEIADAWARASAGAAANGVVYLTATNHGAATAIVAASTPAAGHAALHAHRMEGEMMRMRPVDSLPLAAGETVSLAPGGLHVMLMDLAAPLVEGEQFPLTLTLAGGETVETMVAVAAAGAMAAPMPHHHGPQQ